MAKNHLYLVDGSGYIFRAYHKLPPLTNPEGTPVGAVYGFTAMLLKLRQDVTDQEHPTHMAVIFDAAKVSFRNEIYDDYKANRPEPPEDLVPHMGWNDFVSLGSPLFEGISVRDNMYFVHSYCAEVGKDTIATTNYIVPFTSALHKGNFYGVQFHPEKSAAVGQQLLKNFLNL